MRCSVRHRCADAGRLLVVLAATLMAGASVASNADDRSVNEVEPQEGIVIDDLPYGQVLFEFYKEDYFRSLTTLLVEEDMGRIPDHAGEAELLRGGLYLSYGLHDQAGEIFERLLATNPEPEVRDRAWFFLGKARFQRGYLAEANRAFSKVGSGLKVNMEAERDGLQAQVDIALGDLGKAERIIDQWEGPREWSLYAAYNLGVALIRANRIDEAAIYLNKVGTIEAATEELYSLRDRANLALGFGWLQREDGVQAKVALERIRLQGPFSNAALLGFGWADAADDNYRAALVPWQELQNRNRLDPAVQESLLAIAYAYRKLDANQQAMEGYAVAIQTFEDEIRRLDEAIAAARSGELVRVMLDDEIKGFSRWNWALEDFPEEREETRYLLELIATHKFQGGLRNYRDLQMLQSHLGDWLGKLDVYSHMIEARQLAYEEAIQTVPEDMGESRVLANEADYARLSDAYALAERQRDVIAFATAEQQATWRRIEKLEAGMGGADEAAQAKLKLLKGVLFWDMERDYKYRVWQQQHELAGVGEKVAESVTDFGRFKTEVTGIPERLADFDSRVIELEPQVNDLMAKVAGVSEQQVAVLGEIAADELAEQKQRLIQYRAQAQFAQASIFDRAATEGEGAP